MADYVSYPDDISGLWGPEGEGMLTPAMPDAPTKEPDPVLPASTNGNGSANGHGNGPRFSLVDQDTHDDVARLARAIAESRADVVRLADLQAARAEMEGAFTQQLAVALYELMAASNARFATAEDRINERVNQAVEVHTTRLAASVEANHRAASEMAELIWNQIDSLRHRFVGPIDGLAAFQRDLRHEVGRLSDLVAAHSRDWAQRFEAEAGQRDRHDERMAKAADDLGDVPGVLAAMRDDLSSLREEVAELRAAVEQRSQKGRRSFGRRRSS